MQDGMSSAPYILYITYDGLMEPLGQSQVFQYLRRLARDYRIIVVSYEKAADWADKARFRSLGAEVQGAGIRWIPLRYHRTPLVLGTAGDVILGLLISAYVVLRHRIKIVHARSYIPGFIALLVKQTLGVRFVFDMRGFWIDERVAAGSWRQDSWLYRATKAVERRLLECATAVVSLTHAAVFAMRGFPYLQARPPHFAVIPTCTNLELFSPLPNGSAHRTDDGRPFTLGYVGSVGARYLFDLVPECFAVLRGFRPGARLLILSHGDHAYIRACLRAHDVGEDGVEIKAVQYGEVVSELRRMDAGIFFYKPAFSTLATAPTKLGEFLACGIPCLTNAGIGDVEALLEARSVGVILRETSPAGKARAVKQLMELADDPETRRRCVEAADSFSLERGVHAYDRLYQGILNNEVLS
jgi:glycosyltransferase involved in cell wall biosynthesis